MGLNNGSSNVGLDGRSQDNNYHLFNTNAYGKSVGSNPNDISTALGKTFGITKDKTKSGIVADASNLTLGNIPNKKIGKFIIKY